MPLSGASALAMADEAARVEAVPRTCIKFQRAIAARLGAVEITGHCFRPAACVVQHRLTRAQLDRLAIGRYRFRPLLKAVMRGAVHDMRLRRRGLQFDRMLGFHGKGNAIASIASFADGDATSCATT